MLMQSKRELSETWGDYAENNHEKTTEVQGNYPNLEQNLAEKNIFFSKVNEGQPLFSK